MKLDFLKNLFDSVNGKIKNSMPKSLYGRFLIILITPIILIQIITTTIFYERHWDSLTRNMTASFAGEVSLIVNGISGIAEDERSYVLNAAKKYMNLDGYIESATEINLNDNINDSHKLLINNLRSRLNNKLAIFNYSDDSLKLVVQIEDDLLNIIFSNKRVASSTTYIFVMWVIASALIMIGIATLFLKGQVRSILNLSTVAESFGRGYETPNFKPSGSKEIRGAGIAFIEMKERIKRLLDTRTQMLAGVSHDLKTPLTRMRLALSMLEDKEKASNLEQDVEEMNKMIEGYLKFAQLESHDYLAENTLDINLRDYMNKIGDKYKNHSGKVNINIPEGVFVKIKPEYFSRSICNLVDNSCKYAENILIRAQHEEGKFTHIFIDDDGEGIPENHLEDVFQPFFRIDKSRNTETGGVGLGLSIARDIIHKHGGEIKLSRSHLGGLRAMITLPN